MITIKKKIRILFAAGIFGCLLAALFLLTGCGTTQLTRPNGLYVDDISQYLTLKWERVREADGYEIDLGTGGETISSRSNSFLMDDLAPGSYTLRVRAVGDGVLTADSEWSDPVAYVKDADAGLNYRIINNYTAYEVAGLGDATGNVVIDDTYRGRPVVSIADSAFTGEEDLTGIVFGKNITSVGKRAFRNCSNLGSVVFTEGVTFVGSSAFQRCTSLTSVVLPESLTSLSDNCFSSCESLVSVTLGSKMHTLGQYAFSGCESLGSIVLPDSVKSLGESVFYACSALENATIGSGISEIPAHAFEECSALASVLIPANVTNVGESAFEGCLALASVDLSENVTRIGASAFEGTALTDIELGDKLTSVGQNAFLDSGIWNGAELFVYADNWLVGCKRTSFTDEESFAITAEVLQEGIVGISDCAFYSVQGIMRIEIPESVRYIGEYAFYDIASLMQVTIGNGTEVIGSHDNLLLGTSTWGAGELQDDWYDGLKVLQRVDLSGKTVAFFGCGDCESYGDSFVSAMGILYDGIKDSGANFIGRTSTDGYNFSYSEAVVDGEFVGLALDDVNEYDKTDERINAWLEVIKAKL